MPTGAKFGISGGLEMPKSREARQNPPMDAHRNLVHPLEEVSMALAGAFSTTWDARATTVTLGC